MIENLFCAKQKTLTAQGKRNWDMTFGKDWTEEESFATIKILAPTIVPKKLSCTKCSFHFPDPFNYCGIFGRVIKRAFPCIECQIAKEKVLGEDK